MLATPELIQENAQRLLLASSVPNWLKNTPLYSGRRAPEISLLDPDSHEFRSLPLIAKRDIRSNFPQNFLPPGMELQQLLEEEIVELEHTSGTSEQRTPLLLGCGWWAEQERRALLLNSLVADTLALNPDARRVTINSPSCSNDICYTGVPSRRDRTVGNALFVSLSKFPFLWSKKDLARMAAEALDWSPLFLDVDPVYAVPFALYCERHQIQFRSLQFVVASYEFLSQVHRRILERVFRVPVFNLYGSTETGHLLMENERQEMQPSLETAFLEVLDEDAANVGSLVVTTLTNDFMPLVRYAIGDLVRRTVGPYGSRYELHGRAADALLHSSGRRISVLEVDTCFTASEGIAHYELNETSPTDFRLRYIPIGDGPTPVELSNLRARLLDLLGATVSLSFVPTQALLAESSGKFRLVRPQNA